MALDDLRRRLEALNRGALPDPGAEQARSAGPGNLKSGPTSLQRLVEGHEQVTPLGRCYGVRRLLCQHWQGQPDIGRRFRDALTKADHREELTDADLVPILDQMPEAILFVDLETCGFAGTPVFLIGVMYWERNDLCVEQWLARSYEEEAAIVARFAEVYEERRALISFNGKAFDWPFLCDRAAVSGVALPEPVVHCDLLYAGRRRYRQELPDCRLQTLEFFVCHRRRVDDIPGSEIPPAYHNFVKTGDAREIRQIVHHNFLDLVTLAELVAVLAVPGRR